MVVPEGLQGDTQLHTGLAVDVDELVVLQLNDIAVVLGQYTGHPHQLAGAVGKLDGKGEDTAPADEPVLDQRGHGDDIHVAPGQDGHYIFLLAVQVAQSGDGEQPRVLHHHLVPLHHIQKGLHQLAVVDGEDAVHILLDIGEHLVPRSFDGHAVRNGGSGGEGDDVTSLQTGLHGGGPSGLNPHDLNLGVEQLG